VQSPNRFGVDGAVKNGEVRASLKSKSMPGAGTITCSFNMFLSVLAFEFYKCLFERERDVDQTG